MSSFFVSSNGAAVGHRAKASIAGVSVLLALLGFCSAAPTHDQAAGAASGVHALSVGATPSAG